MAVPKPAEANRGAALNQIRRAGTLPVMRTSVAVMLGLLCPTLALACSLVSATASAREPSEPPSPHARPDSGALPAYDSPAESTVPTVPTVDGGGADGAARASIPRDGRGSLAVGGMLLGGGVASLTASSLQLARGAEDAGVWGAGIGVGVVAAAAGTIVVIIGARDAGRYRDWARAQAEVVPRRGAGLRAAGVTATVGGGLALTLGITAMSVQDPDGPPYGQGALGLGSIAAATGIGLLVGGSIRGRQFERYRLGRLEDGARLRLSPSFGLLPGGGQLGVRGTF